MPESNKRLVAEKVRIKDILNGQYVKEDGWNPNYVTIRGKTVSRVNIMAVVLSKEGQEGYQSVVLDDGTGDVYVRSFEKNNSINNLQIGDMILLIGRLREYGQERYVIPEIIKKIEDKRWAEVRKLELKTGFPESGEGKEEEPVTEEEVIVEPSSQMIYDLIKKLDKGDGVDVDNIIKNSNLDNTEELISNLLREGEVFELKPGKIKVLE